MNFEAIKSRCIEDCGCLLWQGAVSESGNPRRASTTVRREVWEDVKGVIPKGKLVTVDCGRSLCVAPDCLVLTTKSKVTKKSNLRPDVKARRKATAARVNRPLMGKIDMDIAREIRATAPDGITVRATDRSGKDWAKALDCSVSLISHVRRGRSWVEPANNPFAGLMR